MTGIMGCTPILPVRVPDIISNNDDDFDGDAHGHVMCKDTLSLYLDSPVQFDTPMN